MHPEFMIPVRGDSMTGAGIETGDVVKLKYKTNLLVEGSSQEKPEEAPEEAPEYDDYLQ